MSKYHPVHARTVSVISAALLILAAFVAPLRAAAEDRPAPQVAVSEAGAIIQDVTIQTYGVVKPEFVREYLSLRKGDTLDQAGVNRDYANLVKLGGFIPRLTIEPGDTASTVTLHWIVMAKWLEPTKHPFYGDQPLSAPIQGVGFILTSPPVNNNGGNISTYSQLSERANLVRILYTQPLHVNAERGRESDFILNTFGGRGDFRQSEPQAINIYSWNTGVEALYLVHGTNNSQFEFGARTQRSTTALPLGIEAPSLYPTAEHPARNTLLEAGYSHGCGLAPTQWYPPNCSWQYRFEVLDAIGGLGATSQYQTYVADVARYFSVGTSTLALHGFEGRTGGVIPDSFMQCTIGEVGYAKPFCGTDAQLLQAEYRIADHMPGNLHFVLFTETSGNRVRGGTQPFAPGTFQWNADSGVAVIYHGVRVNYAYGNQGGRITLELQGQTF